jgi:hypothetical protein
LEQVQCAAGRALAVMKYKDIDYKVLQTTTPGIWAWSFDRPKSVPVHGKAHGNRQRAISTVQGAIDKWLKANDDEPGC